MKKFVLIMLALIAIIVLCGFKPVPLATYSDSANLSITESAGAHAYLQHIR